MQLQGYRYYDPKTCGFDFTGAMEDISVSTGFQAGGPSEQPGINFLAGIGQLPEGPSI